MANRYAQRMEELGGWPIQAPGFPVTEEELLQTEQDLGAALPADYREFIRDYGAYMFWSLSFLVQTADGEKTGCLDEFTGIVPAVRRGESSYVGNDVIYSYRHLCSMAEDWPHDWLPIGGCHTSVTALAFRGEHVGAVFFYDYGPEGRVADSFDEFMSKLYREEDE